MKTDSSITHYKSKADYLSKAKGSGAKTATKLLNPKAPISSDKVQISEEAKGLSNSDHNKKELKDAGKRLVKDAGEVASNILKSPDGSMVSNALNILKLGSGSVKKDKPIDMDNIKEIRNKPPEIIRRPGLFFISGMSLMGLSSSDSSKGLELMADNIMGGEHFSWKQEDQIIEEIKKRPRNQPVVLVGHSLGGDAAVSIANKLNTLENGFRSVDLMVTLDSVGFNNDIIPQNVKKNLNFIGDTDTFFNDGPNIAKNTSLTNVINELRSEGHRGIDDSVDVQFKIFEGISEVLDSKTSLRYLEKQRMKSVLDQNV